MVLSIDLRLLAADDGRSASGGGVGGKTLRCSGGSDCCRERLDSPGLTRLSAAYDSFSCAMSSEVRLVADMLRLWLALL